MNATTIPPAECQQVADRFRAAVAEALDVPAHVQAEIDARRALAEVRKLNASRRQQIDAEWDAQTNPPRTLDEHLKLFRSRPGWAEHVGRDWEEPALQAACREFVS